MRQQWQHNAAQHAVCTGHKRLYRCFCCSWHMPRGSREWAQPKTLGGAQHTVCHQGCVQLCGPSPALVQCCVRWRWCPTCRPASSIQAGSTCSASAAHVTASLRTDNNNTRHSWIPRSAVVAHGTAGNPEAACVCKAVTEPSCAWQYAQLTSRHAQAAQHTQTPILGGACSAATSTQSVRQGKPSTGVPRRPCCSTQYTHLASAHAPDLATTHSQT